MPRTSNHREHEKTGPEAGNRPIHRRAFLRRTALVPGAAVTLTHAQQASAVDFPPEWRRRPGRSFVSYGTPSPFETSVGRLLPVRPAGHPTPGAGASFTPLERLHGIITPNGLHYERSHSGIPEIDPARHELIIHGLVGRPLVFTVDALLRYPTVTRIYFLECTGNSLAGFPATAPSGPLGRMHGLISCAEWTGVPLSVLLNEAGVDPRARWLLAEGIDGSGMSRSLPFDKSMDDVLVALYQNGERLRPEQGYPVRLFVPGFEGNLSIKWLHRIKVTEGPTYTKDETSKYTDLLSDGRALQFTLQMEVKSTITRPATGLAMQGPGLYEVSGLAWSGAGRIVRVEVSADGGKSWTDAVLQEPVLPRALTRFRLPWKWTGQAATLASRATDERGHVQPTRDRLVAARGLRSVNHYNAVSVCHVGSDGRVASAWT